MTDAKREPQRLRLLAEDEDDLKIISAHLQDAVVRVGDLAFLPKSRRFAFLANRYCWECDDARAAGLRQRTGIHFDNVTRARSAHIRQGKPDAVLQLLAVQFERGDGEAGAIELLFAGGGRVRLDVECVEATMRDLSGPWRAQGRPEHELPENDLAERNAKEA
jgi:hypothetical protein